MRRLDLTNESKGRVDQAIERLLGGYTEDQLQAAFKLVQPVTHWKDRICAVVPATERAVVSYAIEFYTSTRATFQEIRDETTGVPTGNLLVTADGYRAGPAGDH